MKHILHAFSGALICGLGIWIIHRRNKQHAHTGCSSCSLHQHAGAQHKHSSNFSTLGLMGIATGMIPCPSVMVAYLSGVSSGNTLVGIQSIIFFALGMCVSLMTVIVLFSLGSDKLLAKLKTKKTHLNWRLIQGAIFVVIGLTIAFYH